MTRRTKNLSAFAGHLSFPGGRLDPEDASPLAAALRETREEIGLSSDSLEVLGEFDELHTHFGTLVVCFGAAIKAQDAPTRPASPREVEEILQVPVASLRRPGPSDSIPAGTYAATSYESRMVGTPHAPSRTLHYWTLERHATGPRTILWGITGEFIARILKAAYGWTPPVAPRLVERVEDLQP